MRTYWHPLLTQAIRQHYGDLLEVEDAIKLSHLPLEMDLLIRPKVAVDTLPEPLNHLGNQTIVELKGPRDSVSWETVAQIEAYACLYQRDKGIRDRRELTLWIIGSQFLEDFNQPPLDYIDQLETIGPGIQRGFLAKFPVVVIHLDELPINESTFPLTLLFQGDSEQDKAREREVIEYFVDHYSQLREYLEIVTISHSPMFKEVLAMRKIMVDGFEIDLPVLVELFGWERVFQGVTTEEIVNRIGWEPLLQEIAQKADRQKLLDELYKAFPDDMNQFIQQHKNNNNQEEG
jgi:hypothetical protein